MNNLEKGHVIHFQLTVKNILLEIKKIFSCNFVTAFKHIGAVEAYALGLWECDDIVFLIRILIRNQNVMNNSGIDITFKPINRSIHKRRKTHHLKQEKYLAHYDLSNEFYQLWLDDTDLILWNF